MALWDEGPCRSRRHVGAGAQPGGDGSQRGGCHPGRQVATQCETYVSGDAGYTGAAKRPEHAERDVIWSIAARPSSYKHHGKGSLLFRAKRKIEYAKGQLRAKVEHPFQVMKVRFNHRKVRYRGLEKNTAQLFSLFGLANLMLAKRYLQRAAGYIRLKGEAGPQISIMRSEIGPRNAE